MEYVVAGLMLSGAVFVALAAVGVVRLPDLYMRMQATTKATTLGVGCMALAAALAFGETGAWVRAAAIVVFLYLTAPIAAHMIARAAYFAGVRPWARTSSDELKGRYDERTHRLESTG